MERIGFYKVSLPEYTEDEMAVLTTAAFMAGALQTWNFSLTELAKTMGMALSHWGDTRVRLEQALRSLSQKEGEAVRLSVSSFEDARKVCTVSVIVDRGDCVMLTGDEWVAISAPYRSGERYALGTDLRVFLTLRAEGISLQGATEKSPRVATIRSMLDCSPFKWRSAIERLKAAGVESKVR